MIKTRFTNIVVGNEYILGWDQAEVGLQGCQDRLL